MNAWRTTRVYRSPPEAQEVLAIWVAELFGQHSIHIIEGEFQAATRQALFHQSVHLSSLYTNKELPLSYVGKRQSSCNMVSVDSDSHMS